jgi:hypothetical protein
LALAPVNKLTNAVVELALFAASVMLGLFSQSLSMIGLSTSVALGWWFFVHRTRLNGVFQSAPVKAIGSFVVASIFIAVVHGLAFCVGYAFHAIMRLS